MASCFLHGINHSYPTSPSHLAPAFHHAVVLSIIGSPRAAPALLQRGFGAPGGHQGGHLRLHSGGMGSYPGQGEPEMPRGKSRLPLTTGK